MVALREQCAVLSERREELADRQCAADIEDHLVYHGQLGNAGAAGEELYHCGWSNLLMIVLREYCR